uniref:Uncharacterized protein n=1 Tax=Solanum lycopersicum TaxID=4081 RepID=A0A3Q7JGR2_SOLLC
MQHWKCAGQCWEALTEWLHHQRKS